MGCVCLRRGSSTAVLLLYTLGWAWARSRSGVVEPAPRIDGRHRSAITVQENVTHKFNCQSEGWDPRSPHLLTWYLNGERQREAGGKAEVGAGPPGRLVMTSPGGGGRGVRRPDSRHHNSSFSLRPRKWDRELVCATARPHHAGGASYNATVTLNVQFQPEILRVNAHYTDTADPGLSLVLFALVRSNPPATITWVDQSGQLVANTSDFLVVDSQNYPWLTNHTLRVTLSSLSGNVSVNASNSVGATQSNLTLTEFLQSRVEVPMLGILTGGAVAFVTLLILSLLVLCLLQKIKGKVIDEPVEILMTKKSDSVSVKIDKIYLPRDNMSLPSNMQLNDLNTLRKAREACRLNPGERRKWTEEEEEDLSAAYAARGFARYPMVGYIYKVNSKSSDEIWL